MEREIVVRGTVRTRSLPDQASLRVEVTVDHKTQEEAHDARTKLAAVDEVLDRHADAIARPRSHRWSCSSRTRWHAWGGHPHRVAASRTSFVDVVMLDALGEIMAGLVDAGAAVQGPQWSMAPTNPAMTRPAAAEDARRRAQSYAAALGLFVGPVAWVAEPGLRRPTQPPARPTSRAPMAAHGCHRRRARSLSPRRS